MKISDSTRLRFELMSAKDADLMFQLDQDPEVMRYINGGKPTTKKEILRTYIPRMEQYTDPKKGWGLWKILEKESGQFIGWVLLRPMDFFGEQPDYNTLEIGWRLIRGVWGNGYATEAAKAVMREVESNGNIGRFTAYALEGNKASINIMKKLGMRYIKTDIHKDPLGDSRCVFYQRNVKEG